MLKLKFLNKIFGIVFIYYLLSNNLFFSQNLVPNPSFEIHDSCPENGSEVFFATPWTGLLLNSSDYYNACASLLGVPDNIFCCYQNAKEGVAYSGVFTNNGSSNEYIQSKLLDTLENNSCYFVQFFVVKSEYVTSGSNNIGAHFSSNAINTSVDDNTLHVPFHVLKLQNPVIMDTMNWVEISGIYKASGDEQYITIGNFKDINETDTIAMGSCGNYPGAYYYIDDISVIPISAMPNAMAANAGPDIDLTEGDSVFIGQEVSKLYCKWSLLDGTELADSISGIYVQPTENTTYVVEQNLCGVTTYDTVTVFVHGVGLEESSPSIPLQRGKVIPNPNNGSFEIDLSKLNCEIKDLNILDASGRMVYQEKNITSSNKLSLQTHLEKGVYFLRINSEKGIFEEKVVIQ